MVRGPRDPSGTGSWAGPGQRQVALTRQGGGIGPSSVGNSVARRLPSRPAGSGLPIATAIVLVVVGAATCVVAVWRGLHVLRRAPRPRTRDVVASPPAPPPPIREGRRVIAAIGIDRYAVWPRLDNAVNDARGALALFQQYGFELPRRRDGHEVAPLLDEAATSDAIRTLITEDLAQLGTADSLIVFFAGHGHTVRGPFEDVAVTTGYMIPADGDPARGSARRWLRLDTLLSDIARLPPRHVLVILDACHSGVALSSLTKLRKEPAPGRRDRRSRRVITSARDDQSAQDNGPRPDHSVFTGCLRAGVVCARELSAGRAHRADRQGVHHRARGGRVLRKARWRAAVDRDLEGGVCLRDSTRCALRLREPRRRRGGAHVRRR